MRLTDLALAVAGGLALRFGFGLEPVWWLAWLAPAPVLLAALRNGWRGAFVLTAGASLVGTSGHTSYFALLMPLPLALVVTALLASTWVAAVLLARRALLRLPTAWAVLAYPLFWCALDTLFAALHPDGNWGSLAYSQAGVPAAVQIVAVTGTAGLVFALSLLPATLAYAALRGWRAGRWPVLAGVAVTCGVFALGLARLSAGSSSPVPAGGTRIGLAAIDDFIGPRVPAARAERVWAHYERHVAALAAQGARIVVLPEKIAVLAPDAAAASQRRLAALAARQQVWLAAGIGIDDAGRKRNLAWLFAPDGRLDANYVKHHLAPPEREFLPGDAYDVRTIDGTRYGLAICKDMHFAALGRAYGARQAQAMLVPAWDFNVDGRYAARLSALRGIESGFAMVRAAREGWLTVTDPYGRIVAEAPSAAWPGATLLAHVPAASVATPYARFGDWFGWLCTAAAVVLAVLLARRPRPAIQAAEPAR